MLNSDQTWMTKITVIFILLSNYMALPPTNGLHLRHRIHELTPIHVQRDHIVRRAFFKHFEVDHHFEKVFVYFFCRLENI